MNEQQQKFDLYLDERITACKQRSTQLTADHRMDEGNFEKVRANVYEIFKTILSVAEKVCGEDNFARKRFFLHHFTTYANRYIDAKAAVSVPL